MRFKRSANSDRAGLSMILVQRRSGAVKAEDFAAVVRFCVIGLALSSAAIRGAPGVALTIAKAFAAFCCVSPAV
jgi:hypothetical protein